MSKNILVTGGAGYIGSHTCNFLSSKGYTPIVYDNFSTGHVEAVRWGKYVEGDILDSEKLAKCLRDYAISAVVHFAGSAYVAESVLQPERYYRNNIGGTASVLTAMRESKVNKIVYSSSCTTYGLPKTVPIDENCAQNPISLYERSKLFAEYLLKDAGEGYGLRSVVLRYFNAAGASDEAEIGARHNPESRLIPLALAAAANGTELKIFGTDYETPDGTCIRDYIHVDDLASAHFLALELLTNKADQPNLSLNLGIGRGYSVKEVVQSVEKVTGKLVRLALEPRRIGDPPVLVADIARARKVLGWEPKYRDIDGIVGTAWKWYQKSTCGRGW